MVSTVELNILGLITPSFLGEALFLGILKLKRVMDLLFNGLCYFVL